MNENTPKVKVLGNKVLLKQTITKKKSIILTPGQANQEFKTDYEIIDIGPELDMRDIMVGQKPILNKYFQPEYTEIISKSEEKLVSHVIAGVEMIIAIKKEDNE